MYLLLDIFKDSILIFLKVKFTVIVTKKRYYIRFFPLISPAANKNDNLIPSIIVDRNITYPFENNIYLYSYVAI